MYMYIYIYIYIYILYIYVHIYIYIYIIYIYIYICIYIYFYRNGNPRVMGSSPCETDFISRIEKPEHNIEYHIYNIYDILV